MRTGDHDLNPAAIHFQVIIQGDDGDQLWEADSEYATRRGHARRIAKELLKFGSRMVTQPPSAARAVTLTAYIYEGVMVNVGDADDEDWVFEADPAIDTEIVHV